MKKIAEIRKHLAEIVDIVVNSLSDEIGKLEEENQRLWEALEKVNRYNSDAVTNEFRRRYIIGQIVDKALKGE